MPDIKIYLNKKILEKKFILDISVDKVHYSIFLYVNSVASGNDPPGVLYTLAS